MLSSVCEDTQARPRSLFSQHSAICIQYGLLGLLAAFALPNILVLAGNLMKGKSNEITLPADTARNPFHSPNHQCFGLARVFRPEPAVLTGRGTAADPTGDWRASHQKSAQLEPQSYGTEPETDPQVQFKKILDDTMNQINLQQEVDKNLLLESRTAVIHFSVRWSW